MLFTGNKLVKNDEGLLMSAKKTKGISEAEHDGIQKAIFFVITCMTKMKNSNAPKFHQSKIFSSNSKENIY